MSNFSKQVYLEKARAALAARESWRSVIAPTDAPDGGPRIGPAGPLRQQGSPHTPETARPACDKRDQSDRRSADAAPDDPEVAWRAEAMRPQVPAMGPIPTLYARHLPPVPDGCCLSCGEPLPPGNRNRCEPCVQAAWLILREVRGGPRAHHQTGDYGK
jgi:hypothetical protein